MVEPQHVGVRRHQRHAVVAGGVGPRIGQAERQARRVAFLEQQLDVDPVGLVRLFERDLHLLARVLVGNRGLHRQGAEVGCPPLLQFGQAGTHIGFAVAAVAFNNDLAQRKFNDLKLDQATQILWRQRHPVQFKAGHLERVFKLLGGLLQGDQAALANKAVQHRIDLGRRNRHITGHFKTANRKPAGGASGLRHGRRGGGFGAGCRGWLRQHRPASDQHGQRQGSAWPTTAVSNRAECGSGGPRAGWLGHGSVWV